MPAKSVHSYSDTLYAVLDEFNPKTIFEWGPGISTQIMSLHPSVETINSVEHEIIFYDMIEQLKLSNVIFRYEPDMNKYVESIGENRYDMIFIDGRDRSGCLDRAKDLTNIVILHDAKRSDYRESVNKYKYQIWTDDGNTAVLSDNVYFYERAKKALSNLLCDTPNEEKVRMVGHSEFKGEIF